MGSGSFAPRWLAVGEVLVALVVRTSLAAQDAAWRLPPLGAAEYRREWRASASEPVKTVAAARAAPATTKLPDRYLHRLAPAPFVCQAELRADQRALDGPVRDLRDVLRALACDLASRGAVRARFPRLLPYGDVVVSGSWSVPGPDGAQALRASFGASAPSSASGEAREVAGKLLPFCVADASGTVTLTRRFDAAAGVVAAWQGQLDVVADEGDVDVEVGRVCRRLVVDDRWQLVAVRDNQDADFRVRVGKAIRAGTEWVRAAIDEQRSFLVDRGGGGGDERNYGSGRLALGLLTLLHGNVPPDDAVVQRGFAELRRRKLEDTYSLAAALMALAALHTPPGAAARLRDGVGDDPGLRPLGERDQKLVQKWLKQLLENVDPRGPAANVLRFNYTAGPRYDTSLQQYGLLGLWSAHRCGAELPAGAFAAAARHLIAVQGRAGGSVALRLTSHAQLRAAENGDGPLQASEQRARARGFAYQDADEPAFGSMTCAGVSGLLLARAGMAARGERDAAATAAIDGAVRDGYAWLAQHFSVRCNPGFAERADHHWYYWLYCLERSCELAGIARLHGRDWYHEGALQLLAQQQENGSFRAEHPATLLLDSTAFAVLFLAKATAPTPVTGR